MITYWKKKKQHNGLRKHRINEENEKDSRYLWKVRGNPKNGLKVKDLQEITKEVKQDGRKKCI